MLDRGVPAVAITGARYDSVRDHAGIDPGHGRLTAVPVPELTGLLSRIGGFPENSIHLELTNFYDEAWFMLRINDGSSIASVAGGELTQLDGTLYLIRATSDEVDIQLS